MVPAEYEILEPPVRSLVADAAERDEILGAIISQRAPRSNMMDLKIHPDTTILAAPSVTLEYFAAQFPISV